MRTDTQTRELVKYYLNLIRLEALDKGITHQMIADKTGLQQQNVGRTLSGKYMPRFDIVLKLAEATNIELRFIIPRKVGKRIS
jgi:DNA-binding phage protein